MLGPLLSRRVASDATVARLGQLVCFAGACLIPVLAVRRLSGLDVSEAELLIGVVATLSLALLCAAAGLLLEPRTRAG